MKSYPLKLRPVIKKALWGGTYLSENFGIGSRGESISEAWTMSLRKASCSIIDNGEYRGMTLDEYISASENEKAYSLLVKLIDAHENLSVQVHPDDEYARNNMLDSGKTEMWYIVHAQPASQIVYGLKKGVKAPDYEQWRELSQNGKVGSILNYVEVKTGDCFYIPAGLVHALGKGIVAAEIQQNSDTTFRIYDYDRKDADGNKRELHIKQAAQAVKYSFGDDFTVNTPLQISGGLKITLLCRCDCFETVKYELGMSTSCSICKNEVYNLLFIGGKGFITHMNEKYPAEKGDSFLIPASAGKISVCSKAQGLEFIVACSKK